MQTLSVAVLEHSEQLGFEVQSMQTPDPSVAAPLPPTFTFRGATQELQVTAPSLFVYR